MLKVTVAKRRPQEIQIQVTGGTGVGKTTIAEFLYIALRDGGFTDVKLDCKDGDTGKGWQIDVKGHPAQNHKITIVDHNVNHDPRKRQ